MTSPFYFILGGLILLGILGIFALPAVSDIPPTSAFSIISMGGQNITASSYNSEFEIVLQGALTSSINEGSITIKLKEFSCPEFQGIKGVDEDGNWICGLL